MNQDPKLHLFRGHCTRIIGKEAFRALILTNFFFKNHFGHETDGNK